MSSNANRNPKELKDFIHKSKSTSRLNDEIGRIAASKEHDGLQEDENSRLISFYKNRSDELFRKNLNLEKLNHNLVEQKSYKFLKHNPNKPHKEDHIIENSLIRIERAEYELIKKRTEEQSSLIEFYKKRGDEYVRKNTHLENMAKLQVSEKEKMGKLKQHNETLSSCLLFVNF